MTVPITMATVRRDMDRAFGAGDPEALLDLLAIQSLRKRRSDDDVTKVPLPSFPGESDVDALVRDLTIDDAIALTFADLPPSGDPLILNTASFTFKPERKLIGSSSSAKSSGPSGSWQLAPSYHESQLSGGFPAASLVPAQQAQLVDDDDSAAGEAGAGTKSRGFLAGLLSRAVKGRGGKAEFNAGRKSKRGNGRQQGTTAESAGGKLPPRLPPSADGGLSLSDARSRIVASSSAADCRVPSATSWDTAHSISVRAFNGAPAVSELLVTSTLAFSTSSEDPPDRTALGERSRVLGEETVAPNSQRNANAAGIDVVRTRLVPEENGAREFTASVFGQANNNNINSKSGGRAVYTIHQQAVPPLTATLEQSVVQIVGQQFRSEPPQTHQRQPLSQGQDESVGMLKEEGVRFSSLDEKLTATSRPDAKLWAHDTRLEFETRPRQSSSLTTMDDPREGDLPCRDRSSAVPSSADRKGWDVWLEGVETFIDFERDPEKEIDITFKRIEFAIETDNPQTFAGGQTLSDAENLSSMTSEDTVIFQEPLTSVTSQQMMSRVREVPEPVEHPLAKDSRNCEGRGGEKAMPEAPPAIEGQADVAFEGGPFTLVNTGSASKAVHSIEKAITQLSALAFCTSCSLAASKIKADLDNALKEMRRSNNQDVQNNSLLRHPDDHHQNNNNTAVENRGPLNQTSVDFKTELCAPSSKTPTRRTSISDMTLESDSGSTSTVTPVTSTTRQRKKRKPSARAKSGNALRYDTGQSEGDSVSAEGSAMVTTDSADGAPSSCDRVNKVAEGHQKTTSDRAVSKNMGRKPASSGVSMGAESCSETAQSTKALAALEVPNHSSRAQKTSSATLPSAAPNQRKKPKRVYRYAGAADVDNESLMTSTWSEMTSVSSVCDPATSADESSYYSGDDDNDDADEEGEENDEDEDEEEEDDDDDNTPLVRLGLENEDRDEGGLRHERLQRHLTSVLRQSGAAKSAAPAVESVVAATGERLSLLGRPSLPASGPHHVNEGARYPFATQPPPPGLSVQAVGTKESGLASLPAAVAMAEAERPSGAAKEGLLASMLRRTASGREGRASNPAKKGGASPRLFSPDRQVALVAARQMTSDEFRESYDRSMDAAKVKRSQLDSDIPWDLLQFSDTDDDAMTDIIRMDMTSEEEKNYNSTDSDSSMMTSDW